MVRAIGCGCNFPGNMKCVVFLPGYGGGYMERDEVVEYIKRDDSDEEFDEVSNSVL